MQIGYYYIREDKKKTKIQIPIPQIKIVTVIIHLLSP